MRFEKVTIKGFRSLQNVTIEMDSYSAFVGSNGAGKSAVLHAIDWFLNGGTLATSDVHGYVEGVEFPESTLVEVSASLIELTDHDRVRLKQYGRGERAEFRRSWSPSDGTTKIVGNARQGPGFAEVRKGNLVGEFRPAYNQLRTQYPELPDLGTAPSKPQVHDALAEWESNPNHVDQLVEVTNEDANHMFGINGPNVLRDCVRVVLVPAATDIASQVGESGKGSALNELIGALMSEAATRAQAEWLASNADVIEDLKKRVAASVESATGVQTSRVNTHLKSLVPNAEVTLTPNVPSWSPRADATITTTVSIDGVSNDVSRQGHGVQRAVLISMFQAFVPDAELTRSAHAAHEGEGESDAALRLEETLSGLPSLVVCIEEPEIYQHPIRARSFARTLHEFSEQPNVQVILATHSPYFIRPEQYSSLRRFTLAGGSTDVAHAQLPGVVASSNAPAIQLERAIERLLPSNFSEAFFADKVVLVEGPTDLVVIEACARLMGHNLDALGISVLEVGSKPSLPTALPLLSSLSVPAYVVADGDALGANRKHPSDPNKAAQARASHKKSTDDIVGILGSCDVLLGSLPFAFGDPTVVTKNFAIWNDDLESELLTWPSFVTETTSLGIDITARTDKRRLLYKNAILAASLTDMPLSLQTAISAIVGVS